MEVVTVTVNDTVYRLTQDDVIEYIKQNKSYAERNKALTESYTNSANKLYDVRKAATEFFQEAFDESTDDEETTVDLDSVNELLRKIGADEVSRTFSATILIEVNLTDIQCSNPDDIADVVGDSLDISSNEFNITDWNIYNVTNVDRD